MVHSSTVIEDDSTTEEAVIERMIEAMQKFINEEKEGIPLSSVTKSHFQLQINTLQNAPRDAAKLEQIIKAKERENDKATHIEDTQRLVTEIEILKFVMFLVNRNSHAAAADH